MQVTREDLERNYRDKETEELIALTLQDLTPLAREVILEELGKRNTTSDDMENVKREIVDEHNRKKELASKIASPGIRLIAQLVDIFVAFMGFFVIESIHEDAFLFGFGFFCLYIWFADGLFKGQSIGKLLTNIAVIIEPTGKPCNFWRSFLRNFVSTVLGFFDWIFIFGEKHQRLGDKVADTIVINKANTAKPIG